MSTMPQRVRAKGGNRFALAKPYSIHVAKLRLSAGTVYRQLVAAYFMHDLLHVLLHVSLPLRNHDLSSAVPAVGLDACGAQILCS